MSRCHLAVVFVRTRAEARTHFNVGLSQRLRCRLHLTEKDPRCAHALAFTRLQVNTKATSEYLESMSIRLIEDDKYGGCLAFALLS